MSKLAKSQFGILAAVLVTASLIAWGCHAPEDSIDPMGPGISKSGQAVSIVVIPSDPHDQEELSAKMGAERAAVDLGKTYGTKINIIWNPPASDSVKDQIKALENSTSQSANAVLIDSTDPTALDKTINSVSTKMPVMTYGNDAPKSARISFYGVDAFEAGQRLVRELSRQMKAQGKVAVLAGDANDSDSKRTTEGVVAELAKNPGFNVVGVFHCEQNSRSAMDEVRKQVSARKDIQAWIMVGPWALEEQSFMKVLDPTDTRIVALGCLPSELWYVQKGATIYAKASYQMAYVGVQTLVQKLVANQPVPKSIKFDINAARVGRDNVRTWAKSLDTWGFPDVPAEFLWRMADPMPKRTEGVK